MDALPEEQRKAAQEAGRDGAYLRFTGKVILEDCSGVK